MSKGSTSIAYSGEWKSEYMEYSRKRSKHKNKSVYVSEVSTNIECSQEESQHAEV